MNQASLILFRNDLLNKPIVLTEKLDGDKHAMILSFMADLRNKEEVEQRRAALDGLPDLDPDVRYISNMDGKGFSPLSLIGLD
jgi:hypothetical protein